MRVLRTRLRELFMYPSAVAGLVIIGMLVGLAVYSPIAMPMSEAIRLWRGGEAVWMENPRNALPRWYNLLPGRNLPETITASSADEAATRTRHEYTPDLAEITLVIPFEFHYDGFPKELTIFLTAEYEANRPHLDIYWRTPDGRQIRVGDRTIRRTDTYRVSQDSRLQGRLGGVIPHVGLFIDPEVPEWIPVKGTYELVVEGLVFEEGADIGAQLVLYGQVHGLTGTDHRRRDITVALLWGTPIALAFGFLAAVGSTVTTMIIAAIGVWFGGWVDGIIQRITETNMILPLLPILIMVGTLHSRSIWIMLGIVILYQVFSAGIKTYRAMFLQVKESPYMEAATAYGASSMRIVFRYMIPRIIPVLVPQFVVLIPTFVFLEATLAVLGLGDPVLPTWGKVLNDAFRDGALHKGHYYWVLQPSVLLMLTGFGFAMLGFALDRIFNPRLRGL